MREHDGGFTRYITTSVTELTESVHQRFRSTNTL